MTVQVLLFALLRDTIGESSVLVEVPEGTSVADMAHALFRKHDAEHLGRIPVRYAVDETFVANAHVLRDGDCVAIIPPVSGG